MRVNVYAEEMTDRIEVIGKEIEGHRFTGLRFYLELPATVRGKQYQDPFMHRPGDDDSAAVTFWGKRDLRAMLKKAQAALDDHYEGKEPAQATLPESPSWSPTLDCGKVDHAGALKAVAKLNEQAFQGHTDWRLPEIRELLSLVDYTRTEPAIDVAAFPDTKSDWYWTNTSCAGHPGCAWVVSFYSGYADWGYRGNGAFVRAVRGSSARASQ